MSPNAGGGGELRGLRQWVQQCTWSPNKLWRSNSIFNLWFYLFLFATLLLYMSLYPLLLIFTSLSTDQYLFIPSLFMSSLPPHLFFLSVWPFSLCPPLCWPFSLLYLSVSLLFVSPLCVLHFLFFPLPLCLLSVYHCSSTYLSLTLSCPYTASIHVL